MRTIKRTSAIAAALAVAAFGASTVQAHPHGAPPHHHQGDRGGHGHGNQGGQGQTSLPADQMQQILQAEGSLSNGDLTVGIDRTDIATVSLNGTPIKPSFEVNGSLDFQPLGGGQAFFNGDIALKPSEINGMIDAIVSNHLVFQAEHQHMYDFSPMVWFIHFRGEGDPLQLAAEVHNVLKTTSTPLPQSTPSNPTTPLDANRLKSILHGYDAEVGSGGVVTVYVARRDPITIDGIDVNPATNIATNVSFEPLTADGSQAAVIPDFAMTGDEINGVMSTMRGHGWDIGCLYNQETDEQPQLYFSHEFKTGDPYQLAAEVRSGLDQTNAQ